MQQLLYQSLEIYILCRISRILWKVFQSWKSTNTKTGSKFTMLVRIHLYVQDDEKLYLQKNTSQRLSRHKIVVKPLQLRRPWCEKMHLQLSQMQVPWTYSGRTMVHKTWQKQSVHLQQRQYSIIHPEIIRWIKD